MIEDALISGQLGKAIYADGGRYFVLDDSTTEPTECRPIDFSTFFNFGAQIRPFLLKDKPALTALRQELVAQRETRHALTLAIIGMDPDLDNETRLSAIERAEETMKERRPRRFVRARLLGLPLPEGADVVTAQDLANRAGAAVLGSLYETVIRAEQTIALVHETWNETTAASFESLEEQTEATNEVIDLGLFADATSSLVAGNVTALNSLVLTFAQLPEVSRVLSQRTLLLNNFMNRLVRKAKPPSVKGWQTKKPDPHYIDFERSRESIEEMLSHFKDLRAPAMVREFKATEDKERVNHHIEAISNLITQGNFTLADWYLTNEIPFDVLYSEGEHLGMSLWSLAKIAVDVNAFDLAHRLAHYARTLGVEDAVISDTRPQIVKSRGESEKSRAVYEDAAAYLTSDEFPLTGYAEGLKSLGHSDSARLVVRIMAGDASAEAELVRRSRSGVFKMIFHIVRSEQMAEDLSQDTLITIIRKIRNGDLRQPESLAGFVAGVAKHHASQYIRVLRRQRLNEDLGVAERLPDRSPNSLEELQMSEQSKTIRDVIGQLIPRYREALMRFYINEEPKHQIVTDLGLTSSQFDQVLHRARKRFKDLYLKRQDAPPEGKNLWPLDAPKLGIAEPETRLVLVGPPQVALDKTDEEAGVIVELVDTAKQRGVIDFVEAITRRYRLGLHFRGQLPSAKSRFLYLNIQDEEYFVA
jgi:RNA polymerase sigma-70 factor (ECF subfamily)